jgi:hypothetical protein
MTFRDGKCRMAHGPWRKPSLSGQEHCRCPSLAWVELSTGHLDRPLRRAVTSAPPGHRNYDALGRHTPEWGDSESADRRGLPRAAVNALQYGAAGGQRVAHPHR